MQRCAICIAGGFVYRDTPLIIISRVAGDEYGVLKRVLCCFDLQITLVGGNDKLFTSSLPYRGLEYTCSCKIGWPDAAAGANNNKPPGTNDASCVQ